VCEQQCSYESIQNNDCHCFGPEEETKSPGIQDNSPEPPTVEPAQRYAVSILFQERDAHMIHNSLRMGIRQAASEAEAVGKFLADTRKEPGLKNALSSVELVLKIQ
jgi:hypothetical protein